MTKQMMILVHMRDYSVNAGHDHAARILHGEIIALGKDIGWNIPAFEDLT